jgi:uncharacterized protein (DUF1330 family)
LLDSSLGFSSALRQRRYRKDNDDLGGAEEMTAYMLARVLIKNPELYKRYTSNFLSVLVKYEGKLLSVDDAPDVLEGNATGERVVILQFADRAAAERWWQSAEYRDMVKYRHASAESQVLMLRDFAPAPG